MPLPTITSFYGNNVANMCSTVLTQVIAAFANSAAAFTLTATWDPALDPRGGGFNFTCVSATSSRSFQGVVIGTTGSSWPLLFSTGSTAAGAAVTGSIANTTWTPQALAEATRDAFLQCLTTMSGATVIQSTSASYTAPGFALQRVGFANAIVSVGEACAQYNVVVGNSAAGAVGTSTYIGNSNVSSVVGINGNVLMTPSGSSGPLLPQDIDIAINNGANIFSVSSKTFTEPGT